MKKHRVLVVDDRKINLTMLSKILDSHYDVLLAENGEQALALLRSEGSSISAMLLDIIMPVMDGYAVLNAMKADAALPRIPVIVIS
ncbi:MAG: response regulator [Clostridia bacterium]|nr:response regulator [Clostridia bacterium]NLS83996.1 response regulator [Oscillospiraceae bacterium]